MSGRISARYVAPCPAYPYGAEVIVCQRCGGDLPRDASTLLDDELLCNRCRAAAGRKTISPETPRCWAPLRI